MFLNKEMKIISKLEELKKKKLKLMIESDMYLNNLEDTIEESLRVANIASNSKSILDDLERKFQDVTGLNSIDIKFLFFATALQCIRQYILSNEKLRFNEAGDGDKFISKVVPKNYHDILLQSVPYDAIRKSADFTSVNTGISGVNHRYTTLGHDPLLGWFFGTLNILTDSITKNNINLESYRVINSTYIDEPTSIIQLINEGIDYTVQDYKLLIASIIRQALHLGADAFTKMGLPIPIINNVSPNLSSKLLSKECRIDIYSVSRSTILSTLINSIICAIHSLFYNEKIHINRDLYEVKTRKILLYSNCMATSSNLIYVGITKNFTKLDVGGMLVTVYRLINDYKFINKIKSEFVFGEFNKLIKGEEDVL